MVSKQVRQTPRQMHTEAGLQWSMWSVAIDFVKFLNVVFWSVIHRVIWFCCIRGLGSSGTVNRLSLMNWLGSSYNKDFVMNTLENDRLWESQYLRSLSRIYGHFQFSKLILEMILLISWLNMSFEKDEIVLKSVHCSTAPQTPMTPRMKITMTNLYRHPVNRA